MKDEGHGRRRLAGDAKDGASSLPTSPSPRAAASPLPARGAALEQPGEVPAHVVQAAADEIGLASLSGHLARDVEAPAEPQRCDACDAPLEGEAAGRGILLWSRGGELRWDEPALCDACATAITASANRKWGVEEEEG